jgi:murein DD-endopeptidase MepM/ murein hydrolase activator NlpD
MFSNLFNKTEAISSVDVKPVNSQTISLLQAAVNPNPAPARGGGDITIVNGSALVADSGPSGTIADIADKQSSDQISVYVVRKGDTLASIAKLFGVSTNTIVWANDIKKGVIQEGQTLIILPVSGVKHVVAKGDTIASLAKKYKADKAEIASFNGKEEDDVLAIGETIIIPDGEVAPAAAPVSRVRNPYRGGSGPTYDGYYMRPIIGGMKTQGIHGYNGVDLADRVGAPVFAAAAGTVIIAKSYGWNGGYGEYIVIQHDNNTQTLYAHLSGVSVSEGESVSRGQLIGLIGSTGKSTGSHLHFEVRGAANPF